MRVEGAGRRARGAGLGVLGGGWRLKCRVESAGLRLGSAGHRALG